MKKLLLLLLLLTSVASAQTITAPTWIIASYSDPGNTLCALGIGDISVGGGVCCYSVNINGIDYSDGGGATLHVSDITIPKCWLIQNGLPDLSPGSIYNITVVGWAWLPLMPVVTAPTVTYTVPSTYTCTQNCPKKKKRH